MKKKRIIRVVLFALIFVVLFSSVSKVMTSPNDYRNYQWIAGFYDEPKNTLDAVYVGSSNCYTFWCAPLAWEEYGISVFPYSCNSLPFIATEYIIRDARKTQKDALFIVNINAIKDDYNEAKLHFLLDYMPLSLNKIALTSHLAKAGGYTFAESMEFHVPLVRYHSRWSELTPKDFDYELNGLKGANTYSTFINSTIDVTKHFVNTDERDENIYEALAQSIESLLDYCDKEDVNVLFVYSPRAEAKTELISTMNTIADTVSQRGYPVLNLIELVDEIGLDTKTDYYNRAHTNIHGSIKFTYYLSEYLIENYGFEDKRGEKKYKSWDESVELYLDEIAPYALDIELSSDHTDYSLAAPNINAYGTEGGVSLSWSSSKGADGYRIYRKNSTSSPWQKIGETSALGYTDSECTPEKEYTYTVVPFYTQNGEKIFGSFAYYGVKATAE